MASVTQERTFAMVPKAVLYHPDVTGNDLKVYASLSERAGHKKVAWPSVRTMARELHMSPTTIASSLERLERLGLIQVGRSDGEVNHYHLPTIGVSESDTVSQPAGNLQSLTGETEPVETTVTESGTVPLSQNLVRSVPETDTELEERTRTKSDLLPTVVDPPRRDEVWDALVEVFGVPTTETNRSLRGRVCRSLKSAGATRDQVIDRARNWLLLYPDAELTETTLEKHWDRLGRPPLRSTPGDVDRVIDEARARERDNRAAELDRKRLGA